ncbi:MAG: hypothetical protein R2708_25835 [Vicinamibacterales bacterium]
MASVDGLYFYAWSNVAVPVAADARRLDEVDLGTSYQIERGPLRVTPAFDLYLYRRSGRDLAAGRPPRTGEASVSVAYGGGDTALVLQQVVDVVSYRGAYFAALGVTHRLVLSRHTDLGAAVSLGWASARYHQAYIEATRPGLGLLSARVSATRRFRRGLSLTAHADVTTVPDAALRARLTRPTVVAAGLSVGVAR